jgi:hypothetical protein
MMKFLFYFSTLLLNIFYFRYVIYLDRFVEHTFIAYLAVVLYLISEVIRSFNYSQGVRKEWLQIYIIQAFCAPALFYATDIFHILRFRKRLGHLSHLLRARLYDLVFILVIFLLSPDLQYGLYQVFVIGLLLYLFFIVSFLKMRKERLFDPRNLFYSFMTVSLFALSYNLSNFNITDRCEVVSLIPFYFPVVSNTMRLSIFAHFILSIFLVSFQTSKSEG